MLDFMLHEQLFFVCYISGTPGVMRVKFLRPSKLPARTKNRVWMVATNDKGTEINCPLRYVFKWIEDANAKAEEMLRGRS